MTGASGLTFDEAFARAIPVTIEGLEVLVPSVADLIRNKRATGRMKDLADSGGTGGSGRPGWLAANPTVGSGVPGAGSPSPASECQRFAEQRGAWACCLGRYPRSFDSCATNLTLVMRTSVTEIGSVVSFPRFFHTISASPDLIAVRVFGSPGVKFPLMSEGRKAVDDDTAENPPDAGTST